MQGRLIARSGPNSGAAYALGAGYTNLGRGADSDVVLESPHASRDHARIEWDGEHYVIADLGSKNGVTINGRRITEAVPLQRGDLIELPGIVLAFDLSDATLTVGPPAPPRDEPIRVDAITAEVWVRGTPVKVSAKEYLALAFLYQQAGALISKETLAAVAWPEFAGIVSDYNVEQLISRVRRKIEIDPEHPVHLLSVRGLGYRLVL